MLLLLALRLLLHVLLMGISLLRLCLRLLALTAWL
jgi:hypothetical protein